MRRILATLVAGVMMGGAAQAAPVTIGTSTFDDSGFVDTASVAAGTVSSVTNIIGGNLDTFALGFGFNDAIEIGFSDNTLANGTGNDLLVFEGFSSPEAPSLSLSLGGMSIVGVLIETIAANTIPGVNQLTSVFGFDLTGLGVGAGATVTGNLFLLPTGFNTPDLSAAAAINPGVSAVPEPDTLPLFAGGLGLLGFLRWRRKRMTAAA